MAGCSAPSTNTPAGADDEQSTTTKAGAKATRPKTTEAPKQTGPATAKLGETLQLKDSFGKHSADVTVARKRVSTGDEFDKPSRGF